MIIQTIKIMYISYAILNMRNAVETLCVLDVMTRSQIIMMMDTAVIIVIWVGQTIRIIPVLNNNLNLFFYFYALMFNFNMLRAIPAYVVLGTMIWTIKTSTFFTMYHSNLFTTRRTTMTATFSTSPRILPVYVVLTISTIPSSHNISILIIGIRS